MNSDISGQRRVLKTALALNLFMFVIGGVAGFLGQSSGLIADSLDMLADASAYWVALLAIERSGAFKTGAATYSGFLLLALGIGVLLDAIRRAFAGSDPSSVLMMATAALALVVNATVLALLWRFRHSEIHMRAAWTETRADVIANLAVIIAGIVISVTGFRYADLIVGGAIGAFVIEEALEIIREARSAEQTSTE